ncbi:efflux RND transporter periplasmic adaptor subunit [Robertkochia solimangrovi]|uniref:efflux RND transporter periplasmic adaptor subunit n=1 Tax=Robertkochia solimangrovi TaxID=2213046 RepID=UPI00117FEE25|nr:efflux RND transporter periplasmic adaptor subunit [Robertkochia solimangrovi]TRZ42221.1 efflux transporter periplasmic adaptor subunit [Robertkochia solimangrovi]
MKKYIIITMGLILGLISCNEPEEKKEAIAEASEVAVTDNILRLTDIQMKNVGLETGVPNIGKLNEVITLQGLVTVPPQNRVDVSFPLVGYIKSTKVMAGMHVSKGQVLAVIEGMELIQLQQDYLTAKEKFQLAEQEYGRQKELNRSKATSDKLFEQISTERETQRILMTSLAQKLALVGINAKSLTAATIHNSIALVAPVSGLVSVVNINAGKYISSTEKLFEILEMKEAIMVFNAFEKDIPNLVAGQTLEVYSNGDTQNRFEGNIKYINHSLNTDHAAEVTAVVSGSTEALYPGLFVNAEIHVKNKTGLTVPEAAVVQWKGVSYVFKAIENQIFEMVPVEAGISQNGQQHIKSDTIDETSEIVVKNAYTLLMKAMNASEE